MSAIPSNAGRPTAPDRPGGPEGVSADGSWREVEIFVPATLSPAQQASYLDAQVRAIAHDGGEFIHGVTLRRTQPHTVGWTRCHVAYLSGPPGMLD